MVFPESESEVFTSSDALRDVLGEIPSVAVDAETLKVSEIIQTLDVNSAVVHDGELWTANNVSGFVQAFTG